MPICHSLQILQHRHLSPLNLLVTAVLMISLLAVVIIDLTIIRVVRTGADDSSIEEAVDLDLHLGMALFLSRPTTDLAVRFATGPVTLLLTVFIAWITVTRVAILPLN